MTPAAAKLAVLASLIASPVLAQQPVGWGTSLDGLTVFQGNSGLSEGGEFSANRTFLRAGSLYRYGNGDSIGIAASLGQFNYNFDAASSQPWDKINDLRISVPMRFGVSDRATAFVIPQVRWDYETGASASDGSTYGVFSGVAWDVSPRLTIGPAFGAFSELGDSGLDVFPALLVDWDITSRWNLTTGTGLGATGGPGLTLNYAFSDSVSFGLSARSESVRFRLDGSGVAADGVGEDESIPVVVSVNYAPNPGLSMSAFVGAEFDGQLSLDDASGNLVSEQSYDSAPIAGLAVRLRF
jgi:hypothetical protein